MDKTLGQRIGFVQAFLSPSTLGLSTACYIGDTMQFIREHLSYEFCFFMNP